MVPIPLARQDLTSGALVALFNPLVNDQRGDYLVYHVATYPPVVLFRDWLLEEFARES